MGYFSPGLDQVHDFIRILALLVVASRYQNAAVLGDYRFQVEGYAVPFMTLCLPVRHLGGKSYLGM